MLSFVQQSLPRRGATGLSSAYDRWLQGESTGGGRAASTRPLRFKTGLERLTAEYAAPFSSLFY